MDHQIHSLTSSHPHQRVGLITFGDEVSNSIGVYSLIFGEEVTFCHPPQWPVYEAVLYSVHLWCTCIVYLPSYRCVLILCACQTKTDCSVEGINKLTPSLHR